MRRTDVATPVSRRPAALTMALIAVLLALTACSSIPMSGPVGTISADADAQSTDRVVFNPQGPIVDATQADVLNGFITAGKGAADDYSVARQFLTPELAEIWEPESRILIFRADPKIVETPTEGVLQVQVEVAGSIDAQGIRADSAAATTESISVEMAQVDGQWRISEIPGGIMVSEIDAAQLLEAHSLYFYSSSYTHWVPDVRWFVNRQGIAANILAAMLEGPAPYLQGAVTSAFPDGATLGLESVPIVSGTATVDLSPDILQDVTNLRLQQMEQQLRANLTGLNTVTSVKMTAGQPIQLGRKDPALVVPVTEQPVGSTQVVIAGNELRYFQGGEITPIDGVPSVAAFAPKDPAMSFDQGNLAFLDGKGTRLLATGSGREVRVIAAGKGLTAPSFDVNNWIWVAGTSGSNGSRVVAVPPGGAEESAVEITVPWLADRVLKELRISRDGARALLVADRAGTSQVLLAGITRDADGIPQSLGVPDEIFASGPVDTARWVTEDTIVVARLSSDRPVAPEILDLGGPPSSIAPLNGGLQHLSAGSGAGEIFAQAGAALYSRVGNSWFKETVEGVRDPSFPG